MRQQLLWLIIFLPFCVQAQISGRLVDSETGEPIAYARISIEQPKTQTFSAESGAFSFTQLDNNKNYTLHIDALGYFVKKINSATLKENPDILLDVNEELLPTLYIIPKDAKTKIKTYGQTSEGSGAIQATICGRSVEESEEVDVTEGGGIFVNNKTLSKVLSAHINISDNKYKKVIVKVQLYDITNDKPIVHEPMIFNITDKRTGWFKINLDEKNIYIDRESKKIAVMFDFVYFETYEDDVTEIETCVSMSVLMPTFGSKIVVREDDKTWRKIPVSVPLYLTVETYSW